MKTTINGKEIKLFGMSEISDVYTSTVLYYMSQGFKFALVESGSQGEISKTDLTNDGGKTVYRIWAKEDYKSDIANCKSRYVLSITVKKYSDVNNASTLWYSEGEIVYKTSFYSISDYHRGNKKVYVGNEADFDLINSLQYERAEIRWGMKKDFVEVKNVSSKVLLNVIRKQKGYKSVQLKDIARVQRGINRSYYKISFVGNKSDLLLELKK